MGRRTGDGNYQPWFAWGRFAPPVFGCLPSAISARTPAGSDERNRRLKAYLILGFILTQSTKLCSASTPHRLKAGITVCVEDKLGIEFPIVSQAKRVAGEMFTNIGIYVECHSGRVSPSSPDHPL